MVSIFDDMAQITESEVRRMLPLVNEQRRNEALRFKHLFGQFACLKSWLMLQELLKPMGINDLNMNYNEHGKPFLVHHPEVHFNLSHCKNGIAVAVDFSPIGIDIESYRSSSLALIRKTMSPAETEWILSSSDPIETFTQYWTKKEAVVKLRGTGIIDDLHSVLNGEGYRLETHINNEKRYAFSIAFSQIL
jgi:4'-phosphopantetheinyl transferase